MRFSLWKNINEIAKYKRKSTYVSQRDIEKKIIDFPQLNHGKEKFSVFKIGRKYITNEDVESLGFGEDYEFGEDILPIVFVRGKLTPKAEIKHKGNKNTFYEVAKVFLSRWTLLSDEEEDFTLDILKKVVRRSNEEWIRSILSVWELNVKNYEVIENILPEDQRIYRVYSEFLGERSLSVDARQRSLAKAEFHEFEMAKRVFREAKQEYFS